MTEYIKIERPEKIYTEKQFLYSRMGVIGIMKRNAEFKKLRKEEFLMKLLLKEKIEDIQNSLAILDKLLPKERVHHHEDEIIDEKRLTLEQELDLIKKRLEKLH